MNKGFTLIELLVVVLIIGILAAIALPQYQKAVERSRMAEAVQVLGDLGTAQSIFYMQHNAFAASLPDLNGRGDVNIPNATAEGKWTLAVGNANGQQTMTRAAGMYSGAALRLTVYDDGSILKECLPNGHDAFCTMAETAGYGPEEAQEEEEANESKKVKELVEAVERVKISDHLQDILELGRVRYTEDKLPVQAASASPQAATQEIAVEAVAEADEAIEEVAEVVAEKASFKK